MRGITRLLRRGRSTTGDRRREEPDAGLTMGPPPLLAQPVVTMTRSVLATLAGTVGLETAETGAMLGQAPGGPIDRVHVDTEAAVTRITYTPDTATLSAVLRRWKAEGRVLAGFAHSHPAGATTPSAGDRHYAQRLLEHQDLDRMVVPIVQTLPDTGSVTVHPWFALRSDSGSARLERAQVIPTGAPVPGQFDRVDGPDEVAHLARCRVVAIGVGGARAAVETLARAGVGQFVLIDPDTVTATNLATQHVTADDIGVRKVDAASRAVAAVAPGAVVAAVPERVEDVPADRLRALCTAAMPGMAPPTATVLGLWADDFHANAYGARAALDLGVPAVAAGLYQGGLGAEVHLMGPMTASCLRCRTAARYEHYETGGENPTTSFGTPLAATERMNALKVSMVTTVLTAASPERTPAVAAARALLSRLAERPTAVLRLHPELGDRLGLRLHERAMAGAADPDALLMDDTVWLDWARKGACPDCGGEELAAAVGSMKDYAPFATEASE